MRIFGVDPGTAVTGIGIVENDGRDFRPVHFESIHLKSSLPLSRRLKIIYDTCIDCINTYRPDMLAVETAFYGKNIQSTLKLGQARGVAIIAALNSGIPVTEYSPREVKKSVTGNGASSKQMVQYMVKAILEIKGEITDYDCTDALAVALCHAYSSTGFLTDKRSAASWQKFIENNPERVIGRGRR